MYYYKRSFRQSVIKDFFTFLLALALYAKRKICRYSIGIEHIKNKIVKQLLWRRGLLSRPITHVSLIAFSLSIVFIGITFGKLGVFSTSSAAAKQELATKLAEPVSAEESSVVEASVATDTFISEKPRDTVIEHNVSGGETLSTIAEKYGIDTNTLRWANNLTDTDSIKPGQTLKVPPVTGIVHTVASGDSIYSVADKYRANPQAIADWPFNNVDESLKLKVGQVLIVPDGVPPAKPAPKRPEPRYVAQGTTKQGSDDRSDDQKVSKGALGFIWPVGGQITQYRTAYHTGIDIAGSTGSPILAVSAGKVVSAVKEGYGYGWHIIIDHGNGYQTLYAHLSKLNVTAGESVKQGEVIGLRGNTGRSTGPHLHFEVRQGNSILNPLSYLK